MTGVSIGNTRTTTMEWVCRLSGQPWQRSKACTTAVGGALNFHSIVHREQTLTSNLHEAAMKRRVAPSLDDYVCSLEPIPENAALIWMPVRHPPACH